MTTPTLGATITYTLNGIDPTQADVVVPPDGLLDLGTFVLKAKAWKAGATASAITTSEYSVSGATTGPLLAMGDNHTLVAEADGSLWAFGANGNGQVGDGSVSNRPVPTAIGLSGVRAASAGSTHSLAATSGGTLFGWGANGYGQVGDGSVVQRPVPTLVPGPTDVSAVAAGVGFSVALTSTGVVYTWGTNGSGMLGTGNTTPRPTPGVVPGLTGVSAIASGSSHVLALTSSGQVYAWGGNGSSQLGDNTTTTRLSPIVIPGLSSVVAIAAGSDHSLAVTSDGRVWAWGYNGASQLGDGTLTTRRVPTLLASPTGVTHVAAGASHSLARTSSGQVYGWGLNSQGQVGDGTTTNRPSPTLVATLSGIARVSAGGGHSGAVASDGRVYTWGRNTGGQVGDNSTTNRLTPVLLTGTGNQWALASPTISPASGTFATAQTVTMTPPAGGALIRYTLDNTDPDGPSLVYTAPLSVAGTVTVRARAYRNGWAPSAETTRTYTFTNPDVTAPTIGVAVSPAANAAGWHTANATVTFTCADTQSAVVLCGPSTIIASETPATTVTGVAMDAANNRAQTSVVIRRDTVAPVVTRHTPSEGQELPAGTSTVTVTGLAFDATSGVDTLTCNGVAGVVTASPPSYTCTNVPVASGSNLVRVDVRDTAGHLTRVDGTVYVGAGPPATSLVVSPARLTLVAGDTRTLAVHDDAGRPVTTGNWSTNAPTVATVTVTNGVATVDAAGAGTATLTVTASGLTATAIATVLAAGATIPDGTTLWSLDPPSGGTGTTPKRADILRATFNPAFPPEAQPGLFFVDEGTEWGGSQLIRPFDRPTVLRAVTLDGRALWTDTFAGRRLRHVAADQHGGLVVVRESGSDTPAGQWYHDTVRKLDGATGRVVWEHTAREDYAHFGEVAIHPDGTVYVVENGDTQASRLRAFDGATGAELSWDLPSGWIDSYTNGSLTSAGWRPSTVAGPIIREDGAVVLVAKSEAAVSYAAWNGVSSWPLGGTYDATVHLITKPEGAAGVQTVPVGTTAYGTNERALPHYLEGWRLLPDGAGGLLLGHRQTSAIVRLDGTTAEVSLPTPLIPVTAVSAGYETEYVLGDDGAYALVNGSTGAPGVDPFWSSVVTFNPTTLEVVNVDQIAGGAQPAHLRLNYAFTATGVAIDTPSTGHTASIEDGLWGFWAGSPQLVTGLSAAVAKTAWPAAQSDGLRSNAEPQKLGIFVKGHTAVRLGPVDLGPFRHASIRVVVSATHPGLSEDVLSQLQDGAWPGTKMLTIGAAPAGASGDTGSGGTLYAGFNRTTDLNVHADDLKRVFCQRTFESDLINTLVARATFYIDNVNTVVANQVPYEAFPDPAGVPDYTDTIDGYNSNSFVRGLLDVVPLAPPSIGGFHAWRYPGWNRPVPPTKYHLLP